MKALALRLMLFSVEVIVLVTKRSVICLLLFLLLFSLIGALIYVLYFADTEQVYRGVLAFQQLQGR